MSEKKEPVTKPRNWAFWLVGAVALLLLLHSYVNAYSAGTGITRLIQIGREFDARGLTVFRTTPKYVDSRWGFDGQFYAEFALDPLLRDPQLKTAIDSPEYRARRILLSWLAWAGGLGRPFWILNVYAALNLVFWLGFAVLMARLFRPYGWAGLAGFAAMLMTCGIIESMKSALTDFPSFVLMTGALVLGGTGGAGVLALSALMREANVLGLLALWHYRPPWLAAARRNVILGLIAGLPLLLWAVYVKLRLGKAGDELTGGNLTWPMEGIMAKLGELSVLATNGSVQWHRWYAELYANEAVHALLTIISVLTQCVYLLTHREWDNRIWRAGMIFVPYFLCISFIPWESHFTITRHALAITLAFNLLLAMYRRRGWLVWFILGNCFVPYGVFIFSIQGTTFSIKGPVPQVAYEVVADREGTTPVAARFAEGWAIMEWNRSHIWHWGVASHTTLIFSNPTDRPVEARLAFRANSLAPRDLKISARGAELWSTPRLQPKQAVETRPFLIPPGGVVVHFESSVPPARPGKGPDQRTLTFMVMDLQVILAAPGPGR